MLSINENGSTNLITFTYDDLKRRASLIRSNGVTTSYNYDSGSRLTSLAVAFPNVANNLSVGLAYNPASQIASVTRSNDAYAWTGSVNVDRGYAVNALNQYTSAGGTTFSYDGRGNLTSSGSSTYAYSSENLLWSAPSGASLSYDPLGRLLQVSSATYPTRRFGYDGSDLVGEYDTSNALQRRFVFGPRDDEPLVEYDAGGAKTWLIADERGSIIARSDAYGAVASINRYDEYGIPQSGNAGRFQYTGQSWVPELGMYNFKARMYSPTLGRFMQTDTIGYDDGLNWYNYVRSDPINNSDTTGTETNFLDVAPDGSVPAELTPDIVVTAQRNGLNTSTFNHFVIPPAPSLISGSISATIPTITLHGSPSKKPTLGVGRHQVLYEVPPSVLTWITIKHYAGGFFGNKSKFTDEIYSNLINAIGKTISLGKGVHGAGGQTIYTLDWGTQVGTLPDGSITNEMTVIGSHQADSEYGYVVTAYPGPAVWP